MKLQHHKITWLCGFIIPIALSCLLIITTIVICNNDYDHFISNILQSIHRQDLDQKIRSAYFSKQKFTLLRIVLLVFSFGSIILLIFLFKNKDRYFVLLHQIKNSFRRYIYGFYNTYNSFSYPSKIVLASGLLILLLRSVYYANSFYIQYDEAWNYNLFLDKNIFLSIGAYNNYPLHNLITWCFIHAFGNSVFVLRLPSMLMGLLTFFYTAVSIQYFLKIERVAIAAVFIFSCLPVSVFYMMYARGVMFEIFFTMVICSLLCYYIKTGFSKKRILLLCGINTLGTYSMLSHPFFILASSLALLIMGVYLKRALIKTSLWYFTGSVLCSAFFLIPVFLGTGLPIGLFTFTSTNSLTVSDIISHIAEYASFFTGFNHSLYILFCANICILFLLKKNKPAHLFISILMMMLFLLLILIPLYTNVFPVARSLAFIVLIPLISCIMVLHFLDTKINHPALYIITFICLCAQGYQSHKHPFLNWSKNLDQKVYEVSLLFRKEKITSAYNDCRDFDYFIPGLQFYAKQHKQEVTFYSSSEQSTRYKPLIDSYMTCIILSRRKKNDAPKNFKKIYEYHDVLIYKKCP